MKTFLSLGHVNAKLMILILLVNPFLWHSYSTIARIKLLYLFCEHFFQHLSMPMHYFLHRSVSFWHISGKASHQQNMLPTKKKCNSVFLQPPYTCIWCIDRTKDPVTSLNAFQWICRNSEVWIWVSVTRFTCYGFCLGFCPVFCCCFIHRSYT